MRRIGSVSKWVIVAALSVAAPLAAAQGLLDGKKFVGEAGIMGKAADEKNDVISFTDGRFHSSACDQYGFNKAEYQAMKEGDAIRFEATTVSESDGRLHWRGVLKGEVLEGNFTHYRKPSWWRPNPEPIEHWFKAKVAQ
jgi:hypothetical protein